MKTVLCYGDSLTWGYSAEGPSRHAHADRWTTVLAAGLGSDVTVITEGLNGRTTAYDDHLADCDRNGARVLPVILHTHSQIDLIVIMLGANDMKPFICGYAVGARQGMERLVDIVRNHAYPHGHAAPKIVLVSPPVLRDSEDAYFAEMFEGAIPESKKLARHYADVAALTNCAFFDAGSVAATTPLDGLHLDAANTRAIGAALAPIIRDLLAL